MVQLPSKSSSRAGKVRASGFYTFVCFLFTVYSSSFCSMNCLDQESLLVQLSTDQCVHMNKQTPEKMEELYSKLHGVKTNGCPLQQTNDTMQCQKDLSSAV